MTTRIQLKITLRASQPPIWRRIQVKDSITFHKLHEIIQVVMGWDNYHLYDFKINEQRFSLPDEDWDEKVISSRKIKLNILKEKQKFNYTYDFGDGWGHQILVEKVMPDKISLLHPVCLKGKFSCPPEDCGGIAGYYHLLDVKQNKNHPEYKHLIKEWLGEDFDLDNFNVENVNKELMKRFMDGRTRYWMKK